ncbi:MAG: ATP-binding protein [Chloroflexi bacterium]|nr:ATP-binding protein [Chloroflexota bacterium]
MTAEQSEPAGRPLGRVVSGSLSHGLRVRLDAAASVEDMAVGRLVVVEGGEARFFGTIADVALEAAPGLEAAPVDLADPFVSQVLSGTTAYGTLQVVPSLRWGAEAQYAPGVVEGPQPAKTVPRHFSLVREASPQDVAMVFGQEDERHFSVGTPLDMEALVCLNMTELVLRSNGIFGKSGTGKTFLTRLLLAGILQKKAAASLIFDMHNEYGWQGYGEGGYRVKGLKQLFPSQVAVFTLDEESSRRRGVSTDFVVRIGYQDIEPQDMETLKEVFNLTERSLDAIGEMAEAWGDAHWFGHFLSHTDKEVQGELGERAQVPVGVLRALRLSLRQLARLPFLVEKPAGNSVNRILEYLDRGMSVVLEFGSHESNLPAYVLVANILTRRIHEHYVQRTEAASRPEDRPRPLVIVIEEAHKFLSPQVSENTIFGTIAREMRKYNVTLLVVDQRPSGIDEEVMSQVGTKVVCLLDNERDIESVLAGAPGRNELKLVLSRLDSRQQALIFGHALPMPVVIRTRDYGPDFYRAMGFAEAAELKRGAEQAAKELWGGESS